MDKTPPTQPTTFYMFVFFFSFKRVYKMISQHVENIILVSELERVSYSCASFFENQNYFKLKLKMVKLHLIYFVVFFFGLTFGLPIKVIFLIYLKKMEFSRLLVIP